MQKRAHRHFLHFIIRLGMRKPSSNPAGVVTNTSRGFVSCGRRLVAACSLLKASPFCVGKSPNSCVSPLTLMLCSLPEAICRSQCEESHMLLEDGHQSSRVDAPPDRRMRRNL